ncbi:MAG TPA: IclR family transcriptional regulator [Cellulomonadaceae bacterium]|nr:IclR family transcriptional regulator [Cellulomonadaceae bacterium]
MIQSVDRAVRILTTLQGARRMSLGELAAKLGLPPSTVHGIVRTLTAHGMVVQEHDSGRYRLGPATLRLGNVYLDTLDLRTRVNAWALALAQQTGFAVRTGVLLLTDVIVVHHVPRPDNSLSMPEVGIVIPSHASALGKALIAFDADASKAVLSRSATRRSMTGETITDPETLRHQLDEIRRSGVATEVEEAVIGECGLASPLVDAAGLITGAIGVVVPSGEWPVEPSSSDALRSAARAISRELGADRWPPALTT